MSLDSIRNFVKLRGKSLTIEVKPAGYEITNTTVESVPLDGWRWDDPLHFTGKGKTLEEAWKNWLDLLEQK